MRAVMRYRRWWALFYLLGLAAYILAGVSLTPFHGDESTLLYMGRDFYYLFVTNEPEKVFYSANPREIGPSAATEQHLRLLNGTIPKMLYGGTAALSGYSFDQINEQWNWGSDWDWNIANNTIPAPDLLLRTRLASAAGMVAGFALIFWLGMRLGGWPAALAAATFYAIHPALLVNGRRAMMESQLYFFAPLVVIAGLLMLEKRRWWTFVLLGLASGAAIASKHTGAFTVIAIFAGCTLTILLNRQLRQRWWAYLGGLLSAGLIALLTFYALNPAWWGDPLNRGREVLALRSDLLSRQVDTFGGYAGVGDQLGGFLRQSFGTVPMYYEASAWADYIDDQIIAYEASGLAGLQFGLVSPGAALLLFTSLIGLWEIVRRRSSIAALRWPLLAWIAGMIVLVAFITPLEWQRYYLPFHLVLVLCSALGLARVLELMQQRFRPQAA